MKEKKKFLLRVDADLYATLEKWAADELRSVNGQIEFLLTDLAKKGGRLTSKEPNASEVPPLDQQSP